MSRLKLKDLIEDSPTSGIWVQLGISFPVLNILWYVKISGSVEWSLQQGPNKPEDGD